MKKMGKSSDIYAAVIDDLTFDPDGDAMLIDDQSCEMKRMFVSPAAQGCGAGRALATGLIRAAREQAYAAMYLDTSIRQGEALLGFPS
jgi:GNAT superfamily N-acetyltransferase